MLTIKFDTTPRAMFIEEYDKYLLLLKMGVLTGRQWLHVKDFVEASLMFSLKQRLITDDEYDTLHYDFGLANN